MGLDVSHVQLTLTPNDEGNFFYMEEWNSICNVPLENYLKYITAIDDIKYSKSILIVENEKQFEELKNKERFDKTDYLEIFIGEMNDTMQKQLSEFIVNQKLDKLVKFQSKCEEHEIECNTIYFIEPIKVQGMYYLDNIGYQRKGMSGLFYDTFKKYVVWGKKEDFDLAYTCVADEWYVEHFGQEAVNKMRKNFKENFVDKFEFGKSLLLVSF